MGFIGFVAILLCVVFPWIIPVLILIGFVIWGFAVYPVLTSVILGGVVVMGILRLICDVIGRWSSLR